MFKRNHWQTIFFTIAIGQVVSLIGSSAVQFALIWWLAEQTASPMMLGLAGMVAFLPMTFLSPLAGVMADRYNRKVICITADLAMGLVAFIYAILLSFNMMPMWTVLLILGLRGVGGTFQQPALQSIIPQLVPSDYLLKVNGWMQLMASGSFILGPVIGAALYSVLPLPIILLTDVIGAIFASGALYLAKIPPLVKKETKVIGFVRQFREGIQVYKEDNSLFMLVIAQALCMFFFAPLSSFYPLMTSDFFQLTAMHGSIVETSFAVGMLVVALLFGSVLQVRHKIRASYIGLIGMGIATLICGLLPPYFTGWLVFTVGCCFMGAFSNVHTIPLTAYMQETIAPDKMGRAFSLLSLISSLTMPIGLLIGSPVAEKLGVHTWFLISGIGILGVLVMISILNGTRLAKVR